MKRTTARLLALVAALLLLAAACGSDSDEGSGDTGGDESGDAGASDAGADDAGAGDAGDTGGDDASSPDDGGDGGAPAGGGNGTATLTLDNGESYTVPVFCNLEPQIAAGNEILYTATSLSDPYFDVTVWGEDVPFGDTVEIVSTEDFQTYEFSWFSTDDLVVELNGSTITASGSFVAGDEEGNAPFGVEGTPGTAEVIC